MKLKLSEISTGAILFANGATLIAMGSFWVADVNNIEKNVNYSLAENKRYFEQIVTKLERDNQKQAINNQLLRVQSERLRSLAESNATAIGDGALQLDAVENQLLLWFNLVEANQAKLIGAIKELQKHVNHLSLFIQKVYPEYKPPIVDSDLTAPIILKTDQRVRQ